MNGFLKYSWHLGLWGFMVLFVFDYHWYEIAWNQALWFTAQEVIGYMVIFYMNYIFLKKYWLNSRLLSACWATFIIFLYTIIIKYSGQDSLFYEVGGLRNIFSLVLNASLFSGLAWLIYFTQKNQLTHQKNLHLESLNKELQLDLLKSKINPHFIFNTLNNLNTLILRKDDNTSSFIDKLSRILRYGIDTGSENKVPLKKEIEYIHDYIELFKLQEPSSKNIDFYIEGQIENLKVIPFVLTTMLENALKHSDLQSSENGFLHLSILVDNDFQFEIKNSFTENNIKSQGHGISNILKQLELHYKSGFSYHQESKEDIYVSVLNIDLSKMQDQ